MLRRRLATRGMSASGVGIWGVVRDRFSQSGRVSTRPREHDSSRDVDVACQQWLAREHLRCVRAFAGLPVGVEPCCAYRFAPCRRGLRADAARWLSRHPNRRKCQVSPSEPCRLRINPTTTRQRSRKRRAMQPAAASSRIPVPSAAPCRPPARWSIRPAK